MKVAAAQPKADLMVSVQEPSHGDPCCDIGFSIHSVVSILFFLFQNLDSLSTLPQFTQLRNVSIHICREVILILVLVNEHEYYYLIDMLY